MFDGVRYRAYVYINPSQMKVVKTTYSEDGISMDNIYYDNVMHICVYEGKKSLYAKDITKQMFVDVIPTDFLQQAFGESVKGITAENLQARIRGQLLMAFSNQNGGLVLACGNKSEALTGYCTLYGDTCGGLMPIGNLYKTTVFELAKWRNAQSRALPEEVITRAPSAELAEGQKDENSLPPYPVLDAVLRLLTDEQKTPEEACAAGFAPATVEQVRRLVARSAFKRRQIAPALDIL